MNKYLHLFVLNLSAFNSTGDTPCSLTMGQRRDWAVLTILSIILQLPSCHWRPMDSFSPHVSKILTSGMRTVIEKRIESLPTCTENHHYSDCKCSKNMPRSYKHHTELSAPKADISLSFIALANSEQITGYWRLWCWPFPIGWSVFKLSSS